MYYPINQCVIKPLSKRKVMFGAISVYGSRKAECKPKQNAGIEAVSVKRAFGFR